MTTNANTALPRIGLIGVGNMGMPIARRLRNAGYPVSYVARRAEVIAAANALGARQAASLAELGAVSDIVIVNVFNDDQLLAVTLGADGVLAHMRYGSVFVSHTTGYPATMTAIAQTATARGVDTVDATMSGGPTDIDAGTLVLLVGATIETLERTRPVFATYCEPIVHVGAVGDAQLVKLLNNTVFGAHVALVRTLEDSAVALGLDPRLVLAAIEACSGRSYAVEVATMMGSGAALVAAARKYIEKDVAICAAVAAQRGVDLGYLLALAQRIDPID